MKLILCLFLFLTACATVEQTTSSDHNIVMSVTSAPRPPTPIIELDQPSSTKSAPNANTATLPTKSMPTTRYYVEGIKIKVNKTDNILNQLKLATIAFVVPASANIDKPFIIQLMINPSLTESELTAELSKTGIKTSNKISVSKIVLAKAVSSDFTITPITPETQALANTVSTEWLWEVKPNKPGIQDIQLTITALVEVDGEKSQRHLKTFEKIIKVEISPSQIISQFVTNYWQWLWTVMLAPLLALAWRRYQNKQP